MRFYRVLLHLYPASFRAEYGRELATVFAARRGAEKGLLAAIVTMCLAIGDVVPNAIAEHWEILLRDLGYARRSLGRTPGFALTAVLVVALGIGANAAAFSVANFVLLRPLPFAKPQQLVRLWEQTPGYGQMELSPPNYRDWKTTAKSFSGMGAFTSTAMNLTGSGEPRRLNVGLMSWDITEVLGVHAFLGRTFVAADTASRQAALLSYDLWQTQFGAEPGVVGRRVELDGTPFTIVGVMPRDFRFPSRDEELWTPLEHALQLSGLGNEDRTNNMLDVVGRLKDGVTLDQARAELTVIAARLEREFPKDNERTGATVAQMSAVGDRNRLLLYALCGAALCILLLACANLANLLLVRALGREREIAVRAALGAGRDRLARQVMTESVLLIAVGAAAGFGVATLAIPALTRLVPISLPIAGQPSLDLRILLAAGLVIALVGVGFGVLPALRGTDSLDALRDGARSGGGRKQRTRSVLVMVEVMASVVLLISSGLLMRAMWQLQSQDPGFRAEGVLTLRTALPGATYGDPRVRYEFYTRVLSRVRALPGVSSAAYITGLPMGMRGGIWPVVVNGQPATRTATNSAALRQATPGFFSTLGIPLRRGRDIAETDDATRPSVAVVSESFAKRYWANEDPMGKRFTFALREREVVGIVADVRWRGLEQPSEPQVYVPPKQVDSLSLLYYAPKDLVMRTSASVAQLMPEIRRIVREADPHQPISNVQMLTDVVAANTASRAAQLRVLEILAAIALLLATVGIHGLLSFTVSKREQEIGVRVALGAKPSGILSMFLREGILLSVGGILPGVAIAYAAGRGMGALLAGVAPSDPLTVVVGVTLCAGATILGSLRPALRASRTDPIAALRAE